MCGAGGRGNRVVGKMPAERSAVVVVGDDQDARKIIIIIIIGKGRGSGQGGKLTGCPNNSLH